MIAVGWVGLGAGLMPRSGDWRVRVGALALFGFVSGFVFGAIMNLWFWPFAAGTSELGWSPDAGAAENLRHYLGFYVATSLGWDVLRAVGNAAMVVVLGRPLLGALDRAARRMRLEISAPTFESVPKAAPVVGTSAVG
jgi:energy-coupling factor transport system substrate-specific component